MVPSPNKPPSPEVESGVDELHTLSLHYPTARQQVAALQLDVLIFGEMNSEPVNHFLGAPAHAVAGKEEMICILGHPLSTHAGLTSSGPRASDVMVHVAV